MQRRLAKECRTKKTNDGKFIKLQPSGTSQKNLCILSNLNYFCLVYARGPCTFPKVIEQVKTPFIECKVSPRGYSTLSAGTKPSGEINPLAIEIMKEVGIDISNQKSKEITEDMMRNSTKIVNMGCMDKSFCPTLFIPNVIDWGIEDPKGKPIEKVREIRDDINRRVRQLAAELAIDSLQANL